MTVDHSSVAWAKHASIILEAVGSDAFERARHLEELAADMDDDGKDFDRGPHAPPIKDLAAVLRLVGSRAMVMSGEWNGYAEARDRAKR